MSLRRRFITLCAAATIATLPLVSCTAPDNAASGNSINMALAFKPVASLSPFSDDALLNTRMGIAEPLITLDANGEPEPALAESWKMTDNKTAVFTLRKGVKFHDGTELTAKAVVNSLQHAVDAPSRPKGLGKSTFTFKATSDTEVTITSADADPTLIQRFADPGAVILAESAYSGKQPSLVGTATGPFELKELTDTETKTEAFADYWGGKPALDGVNTVYMDDGSARARAIRAGEISLAQAIPVAQLAEVGDAEVTSTPIPRSVMLHLNTKKGAFADPALRAAAAESIKPDAVVTDIYEGQAENAKGSMFNQNTDWAKGVKSKNSLAGTTDPKGKAITLATWSDRPELPEAASVLAEQLRKKGFDVKVVVQDYDSLEAALLEGKYDAVLASRNYQTGTADPVSYLSSDFSCDGSYNLSLYCNAEVDKEINAAAEVSALEERYGQAAQIGAQIVADNAVIPIAHENAIIAHNNLENIEFDTFERKLITKDTKKTQ